MPPPMQVIPVAAYASSSGPYMNTRPGAIMFLAVTGLLVAIFGALFSGYFLLVMSFISNITAARTVTVAAPAPTTGPVWTVAQGPRMESPRLMTIGQQRTLVAAIVAKQAISADRQKLLNNLITQHGIELFELPDNASRAYITGLIIDAGKTEDGLADYFVFPSGRLQISDQSAIFRPTKGVDVYEAKSKEDVQLGNALSVTEIQQIMSTINAGANATINPAQAAAVQKYLADPTQELFNRTPSRLNTSQKLSLTVVPQGDDETMLFSSTGGWVTMDAQGNITSTPRKPAAMWGGPLGRGNSIPKGFIQLSTFESVTSILLSIVLFVLSILTMRLHPKTRKWLIWFAILKSLTVAIGIAALYQLITNTTVWSGSGGVFMMLTYAVVALVYPALVLILMNTKSVKSFYATVGE